MAAGDRLVAERADEAAGSQLMLRVAYGELPRDRERIDPWSELAHRRFDGRLIQRLKLLADRIVTARDPHDESVAFASETRALHHWLIEAHENGTDRAEALLDDGIGCERRRDRDE